MKKVLSVLLSVLLLVGMFVSCEQGINTKGLVSVRLNVAEESSKGLSSSIDYEDFESLTWYYKADTASNDFNYGEKTDWTEIELDDAIEFSQGIWDFELQARAGESVVYAGSKHNVLITAQANGSPVNVQIPVAAQISGNGEIAFGEIKINLADGTEASVTPNKAQIAGYEVIDINASTVETVPAGTYEVNVWYLDVDGIVKAEEKISVSVYNSATVTISGNLSEITQSTIIGAYQGSPVTVAKNVVDTEDTVDGNAKTKSEVTVSNGNLSVKIPASTILIVDEDNGINNGDIQTGFLSAENKKPDILLSDINNAVIYELTLNVSPENTTLLEVSYNVGAGRDITDVFSNDVKLPEIATGISLLSSDNDDECYMYDQESGILTVYVHSASYITFIEGNEYNISTTDGLSAISNLIANDENNFAGKTVKLDADIDLTNVEKFGEETTFTPIGSTGERDSRGRLVCDTFEGTFDGQNHTIKGIVQNGWDMGYEWGQYGSVGLFSSLNDATVKNVTIEAMDSSIEGGDISFIAGSATGNCVFENITITNSTIGTYNNGCGGIIGWSGAGEYTFKDITIGSDVVLGGLWGSFDSSIGGIVGQAEPGATYNFENVTINCRIDAYNDCTASYDYYNYRMCGMIIGRCAETTTIDGANYPDISKYNLSFNNVVVNYGDWMNYHYCRKSGERAVRVEAGYAYGGIALDRDHSTDNVHCYECIPFNQLVGGDQYGVKGLPEISGVTVNYPAEYTCTLCGATHN